MKLIIDISKATQKIIHDHGEVGIHMSAEKLLEAITDSIQLPKGHGRLIDADKTISKICGSSCGCHLEECGHDEPCFSVTRIESAPTIIEADMERSEDDNN